MLIDEKCSSLVIREIGETTDNHHNVTVGERLSFEELLRVLAEHLDLPPLT